MALNALNNSANYQIKGKKKNLVSFQRNNVKKYIYLCQNSLVSDAFVEKMANGIRSTGKIGRKVIKKQNLEFVLAQKTTDVFPYMKGMQVPGSMEHITYDESSAVALYKKSGNKLLALIGFFEKPELNPPANKSDVRHEIGHQIDCLFHNITGSFFTQTKGFNEAYLKDIEKLPENMKKYAKKVANAEYFTKHYVSGSTPGQASNEGKREILADIYSRSGGKTSVELASKGMDKLIGKLFPNTINYVEKLLYLLGNR